MTASSLRQHLHFAFFPLLVAGVLLLSVLMAPFSKAAGTLIVDAGPDQAVGFSYTFYLVDAYADELASEVLVSASVDWGDGTSDIPTQLAGTEGRVYLQSSHYYNAPETYDVTVCANDGVSGDVCDVFELSVVGPSSDAESSTTTTTTTTEETAEEATEETTEGATEEEEMTVEEDQEVILTEDEETEEEEELGEEEVYCSGMTFTDVDEEDEAYDSICLLWSMDVIHGKTETIFDPDDVIRRDEAAKVFTRLFDYVEESYGETPDLTESQLVDVNQDDPLAYYVEVATDENVMDYYTANQETGESDGWYFEPHEAMTVDDIQESLMVVTGVYEADEGEEEYMDPAIEEIGDYARAEDPDTMTRASFVDMLIQFID